MASPVPDFNAPQEELPVWDTITRQQIVLTFGGVLVAMFLASLDQTIVSTAMPRIIADLGGFAHYTWVTTAYLLASTTVVPIVGRLSDMFGRKWFFTGGIVIFLVGSILSGLSANLIQLIVFRGIQGIGGGVMMANAFVSIGDIFPPADRPKYQGYMGAVFGLSSIIGPTLGGFVTDSLSWHWIFYINLPLGIPAVALFIKFFPTVKPAPGSHKIDYIGAAFLVGTVMPLLLALSWGGTQYAWSSAIIIGLLVWSLFSCGMFLFVESRAPEPIMPLSIFRNQVVSASMVGIFLTGFGMFGAIVFVPLFFQGVLGASATNSGSFLTPMMLAVVIAGAISGQALSRLGGRYRIQAAIGLAIMALGMFMLSRMTAETSYARAVLNIVTLGLGLGTTFPLYTIAVQNAVDYRVMGVATSTTQFVRSIGGTMGLAILGSVMTGRFGTAFGVNMPAAVKDALPPDQLAAIAANPQALLDPSAMARLQQIFASMGDTGANISAQFLSAIESSLATAIAAVFVVGLVATVLALIATLFLKEIPLTKGRRAMRVPAPEM